MLELIHLKLFDGGSISDKRALMVYNNSMLQSYLLKSCKNTHNRIVALQRNISRQKKFGKRFAQAVILMLYYCVFGVLFILVMLLSTPQLSFAELNKLDPTHGYTKSYSKHRTWQRSVQIGTAASTLVIVIITIINGVLYTNQAVQAVGDCNIGGTITLNQLYIDSNNCGNVNVTSTATITVSSIDLGGSGDYTLKVNSGVTATLDGSLTLSDAGDSLQIDGVVKHPSSGNVSLNITAQNITITATGSMNTDAIGCAGGATVKRTTDKALTLCLVSVLSLPVATVMAVVVVLRMVVPVGVVALQRMGRFMIQILCQFLRDQVVAVARLVARLAPAVMAVA